MIDVYSWPTPNGHKVHILLEECALPYRAHAIDIGAAKRIKGELLLTEPVALMQSLKELLLNAAELKKMSEAAKTYSVKHQGATNRILAALDQTS